MTDFTADNFGVSEMTVNYKVRSSFGFFHRRRRDVFIFAFYPKKVLICLLYGGKKYDSVIFMRDKREKEKVRKKDGKIDSGVTSHVTCLISHKSLNTINHVQCTCNIYIGTYF